MADPIAASKARAWLGLLVGSAGALTLPAAVELARRSQRVALIDAAYAVPLAFLLGLTAVVMARRAKRNLEWLRLRDGGTGIASAGLVLGTVAVCLAISAALAIGFYELVLLYQRYR